MSRKKLVQRKLSAVPRWVLACFVCLLCSQLLFRGVTKGADAGGTDLPAAPSADVLRVLSLGEPIGLSKLLMLYLQAFDHQPGLSLSFRDLDYDQLAVWLDRALELDPQGVYPLLSATRVYGEVQDPARQRKMIAFTAEKFAEDPNARWPWMAQAVFMARHRLKDLPLALALADQLAETISDPAIPSWVGQMRIFLREDMGEYAAAEVLLGALLASGQITDAHEQRFLHQRLAALKQKRDVIDLPSH